MATSAFLKQPKKDLQSYMLEQNINPQNYFINTIRLGANIPTSSHSNLQVRKSIQDIFQTHQSVYLIVSTIEPRKNHQYLLDTFEKLWNKNIDTTLLIVGGSGWMVEGLMDKINNTL